ncbi:MAG: DoxX family protein [Actinomycetota bacterium]
MDLSSLVIAAQIIVALTVANVWLLRAEKPTPFRGGSAQTLREEFAVYGLPAWSLPVVRALKLACAALLLVGLASPDLTLYGAYGMAFFMVGAVAVHLKIRDPLMKSMPAAVMLALCLFIALAR